MKTTRKGTFYRVQSVENSGKEGTFVARDMPTGGRVVTIRKDSYTSAKRAAAKALAKQKQPA